MVAPPFVFIKFTDNPESYKSAKSGQMEHQLKCFSVTKSKSFVTKRKTFFTATDFNCIYINVLFTGMYSQGRPVQLQSRLNFQIP